MALKQEVGPFKLASSQSGSHEYENVQDLGRGKKFVYTVSIFDDQGTWRVMSGLYGVGFDGRERTPSQLQQVERFGSPMGTAPSFRAAKEKAYGYMRRFSGSPGYNGMIDLADAAGW
jgi:hypothetical protein